MPLAARRTAGVYPILDFGTAEQDFSTYLDLCRTNPSGGLLIEIQGARDGREAAEFRNADQERFGCVLTFHRRPLPPPVDQARPVPLRG